MVVQSQGDVPNGQTRGRFGLAARLVSLRLEGWQLGLDMQMVEFGRNDKCQQTLWPSSGTDRDRQVSQKSHR